MGKEALFRTCVFGGYNKQDVNEYIDRLEEQVNKAKSLNDGVNQQKKIMEDDFFVLGDDQVKQVLPKDTTSEKEISFEKYLELQNKLLKTQEELTNVKSKLEQKNIKCQKLESEINKLRSSSENYEEDYKAVKNVLLNARVDAEIIVAKAREKAEMISKDSQKKLIDKKKDMVALILKLLDENGNSLDISKSCLETQVKSLVMARKQMESMRKDIERDYVDCFSEDTNQKDET